MSKIDNKKEQENKSSQDKRVEKISGKTATNNAHLGHIAITRNMPPRKQALDVPMESAAGLGGRISDGAHPPGTINDVSLTTAMGTVSESEQRIAASPYGKVLPPQLTSEGKFKCRCCSQIFITSDAYTDHYRQNHLPQM